jgi:hypothetical protein
MISTAKDELALTKLPPAARKCYKFPKESIATPLMSVRKLDKANLRATFENDQVTVINKNGAVLLHGIVKKNIQSTKPNPKPQCKFHDVSTHIIEATDIRNLIATDLPGRYPITSARGHKYLFLMYDHDSNFINAIPLHSR